MDRCMQCNSTLGKDDRICWGCDAAVPEKNPKPSMAGRFQFLINGLFILFAVLTVLALFLPAGWVPSFGKCLGGLVVLFLVRSSSHTMTDARKG
jgi:hypothetical protein